MQDAGTIIPAPPPTNSAAQPKAKPLIPQIHADYFAGIIPQPPVVCGLQLKPLSIGRWRLMARFNVAFAAEGEATAGARDLLLGVLICSMRCEDFKEFVASEYAQKQMDKWGRKFGFLPPRWFSWPFIGRWLKRLCEDSIAQTDYEYITSQMALFQKYIVDGSPDFSSNFITDPSHEGIVTGSHWSQNIEAALREYLGWTKYEIDEEPLTKALWDFYKQKEQHGLGRFMTPDETEQMNKPLTPEQIAALEELSNALAARQKGGNG